MKLLVAIPSSKPKELSKKTLLWAPRAGFDLRIFTDPSVKKKKYREAVDEANYQQFLAVRFNQIVTDTDPLTFAQKHGYDLLAILPPNLYRWNETRDTDRMVIEFQTDLAQARKEIGSNHMIHQISFENGARIVRVVELGRDNGGTSPTT
jgi:hypothetical protein